MEATQESRDSIAKCSTQHARCLGRVFSSPQEGSSDSSTSGHLALRALHSFFVMLVSFKLTRTSSSAMMILLTEATVPQADPFHWDPSLAGFGGHATMTALHQEQKSEQITTCPAPRMVAYFLHSATCRLS